MHLFNCYLQLACFLFLSFNRSRQIFNLSLLPLIYLSLSIQVYLSHCIVIRFVQRDVALQLYGFLIQLILQCLNKCAKIGNKLLRLLVFLFFYCNVCFEVCVFCSQQNILIHQSSNIYFQGLDSARFLIADIHNQISNLLIIIFLIFGNLTRQLLYLYFQIFLLFLVLLLQLCNLILNNVVNTFSAFYLSFILIRSFWFFQSRLSYCCFKFVQSASFGVFFDIKLILQNYIQPIKLLLFFELHFASAYYRLSIYYYFILANQQIIFQQTSLVLFDLSRQLFISDMLREIHIDQYSKIISQFKPSAFSSLYIVECKPYSLTVQSYIARDDESNYYQIYATEHQISPILQDVPFIQVSPKILFLTLEKDKIIVQEKIDQNLYECLLNGETKPIPMPYIQESTARQIISNLRDCIDNYDKHKIFYNAISPKNIVRRNKNWQLTISGLLLQNDRESADYYKTGIDQPYRYSYALGTLLFKLLFGFVPFEKRKEKVNFNFSDYLKYLDKEQSKKYLKTYYFADRMLDVSDRGKHLIEQALRGDMTLNAFYNHQYFYTEQLSENKIIGNPSARQIKMMSIFKQCYQSQIMAAIEHRKKYPQQKLQSKLSYCLQLTKDQTIDHLKRHSILCEINFDKSFNHQKKIKQSLIQHKQAIAPVLLEYFYREESFDPTSDYPCRDLLNLIQNYKAKANDNIFEADEAKIKLYAYPYAIIFQLIKVQAEQPQQIVKKIRRFIQDLLQVSELSYTKIIQPLHQTQLLIKSFEQIKTRFREQLNELYKYFMNQAMKRYNVKKGLMSYEQRFKVKNQGLEYYRLCLKLIQCSVLLRKGGKDLDLNRIETSQRKQIEQDLNVLLKSYFPNKIELN